MSGPQGPAALAARGLSYSVEVRAEEWHPLVQGADLDLEAGALVSIRGPASAAKTALLEALGLMRRMDEGELRIDGADVAGLDEEERGRLRRERIGVAFGSRAMSPAPALTPVEAIAAAMSATVDSAAERTARAVEVAERVGLSSLLSDRMLAYQLPGADRALLGVAVALANRPRLLLVDEPTAALWRPAGGGLGPQEQRVLDVLAEAAAEGCAVVYATRNRLTASVAPRRLRLAGARLAPADDEEPTTPDRRSPSTPTSSSAG